MEITTSISTIIRTKSSDVWTISAKQTVFEAIQQMSEHNVGALPVVDDSGALVGIVSERDYTRKVILKGESSQNTLVEKIMSEEVISVGPDESITSAMQLMTDEKVRHLPVIDSGKLVGIVTIGDMVKWMVTAQGAMIEQLESYIHGSYQG